ncbi:MAG: hypothetical protein QGG40_07365, partial [Myxococcota bacterium]|nr:hypothetical protein [Myxococcota bacterium]
MTGAESTPGGQASPGWVDTLRLRYLAGESSFFLLHGNVRDVYPWHDDDAVRYISLPHLLRRLLGRSKDHVVTFNLSEGLDFGGDEAQVRFRQAMDLQRATTGKPKLGSLPMAPDRVLPLLESLVTDRAVRAAVVLD